MAHDLLEKQENFFKLFIFSENVKQIDRLKAVLDSEEINSTIDFEPVINSIYSGFYDRDLKICCYTDHQIFERYYKFKVKNTSIAKGKEVLTLSELQDLQPGDYVVHSDHGIGRFGGLQTTEENGKRQEVIRLTYRDNDILLVSIHSLHRISKYRGKDGTPPKIYKLGSGTWQALKKRTKSKVKDIAKELKKNYKLAILSNHTKEWIEDIIKKHKLKTLFNPIVASCYEGYAKPNPKIYEILLKKLKIKSRECLFIDNKDVNDTTADNLGFNTIIFKDSEQLVRDLKKLGLEVGKFGK